MQSLSTLRRQFALWLLCLALLACSKHGEDEQFSSALAARYQSLTAQQPLIPLTQLTNFAWDQVFLFGPYTSTQELTRITGVAIDKSASHALEERDDIHILVFLQQKKLAKLIAVPRGVMNFAKTQQGQALTPQQAVLVQAPGQLKTLQWQGA